MGCREKRPRLDSDEESAMFAPVSRHDPSDWHCTDIVVRVKNSHDNTGLIHQTGVIRRVSGDHCSVHMHVRKKTFIIPREDLEPVPPAFNEKMKVILGDLRGGIGSIISIDRLQVVVRLDDLTVCLLPIKYVCKLNT